MGIKLTRDQANTEWRNDSGDEDEERPIAGNFVSSQTGESSPSRSNVNYDGREEGPGKHVEPDFWSQT